MGQEDVRDGKRRVGFFSSSIQGCLDPEVLFSARLCFLGEQDKGKQNELPSRILP